MTNPVNTHGLKMTGLRRAAGETKSLRGTYDPNYVQISYDKETGDIITNNHYDLGHSWQTNYCKAEIINIGIICFQATMQQIADMIDERMKENESI